MSFDRRHVEKWVAYATLYVSRFGLSVIPMGSDKNPLIKWLDLQSRRPTVSELLTWPKENLAIVTGAISNLVVVDCESREDAEWFYKERGKSPVVVQSRRGFHFYFQHPGQRVANAQKVGKNEGMAHTYDVRGDGGCVLAPPSLHSAGEYRWSIPLIEPNKLPHFDPSWRQETVGLLKSDREIRDAQAYISKIRAVQGSGGNSDTFRAACALKDAGLAESEALLALREWNRTNADPPWSDRDLLQKIRSAYAR